MNLSKPYLTNQKYPDGYPNISSEADVFQFIDQVLMPKKIANKDARGFTMPIIYFLRGCKDGAMLGEVREACGLQASESKQDDGPPAKATKPSPYNQLQFILRKMKHIGLIVVPEFKAAKTKMYFNTELWNAYISHKKNEATKLK